MVKAVLKEIGGSGSPLLMIHGFGSDSLSWSALVAGLSNQHRLLAVDLPGHGKAANEVGDGSIATLADAVGICLQEINGPVHMIGHSLGGAVAADLERRFPEKILSLLLLAPAGLGAGIDKDFLDEFPNAASDAEIQALLVKLVARESLIQPPLVAHVKASLANPERREALRIIAKNLIEPISLTPSVECTSTIIWGEDDKINPFDNTTTTDFSNSVHVLNRCGHLPHVEAASKVVRIFREAVLSQAE